MNIEMKLDEKKIADELIKELKKQKLLNENQTVNIIYNAESKEVLYTVQETAKLLKSNATYVYELIKAGLLPVLKLGSYKIRRIALLEFLEKYEGKDLTNPIDIKDLI